MKKCSRCKVHKPRSEFSKQKDNPDGLRYWCRTCVATYNSTEHAKAYISASNKAKVALAAQRKREAIDAMGGGCIRCGYKKYVGAIDFHHLVPGTKKFGINASRFVRKYHETVEELKKTVCLCKNCHAELHAGLWSI